MEMIPENPIIEFLPDTLVAIKKIYNLENGRMDQSVDILEEWIKKQAHFVNKNFSRPYLERTLIVCKGSVEKAKIQLDKLCTFKTMMPKFFTISSNVRSAFAGINKTACILPLPKMTRDYQRIILFKIFGEFTSAQVMDFYKLGIVLTEYIRAHDYVNGIIMIDDFRDVDLMDILKKVNLIEFQQILTILMKGYGAKLRGIHLITPSSVVDMLVTTFKTILSAKLAARIKVHLDLESLQQVVDRELLPADLGGKERTVKKLQDDWVDVLASEEHEKYLAVMKASCTDESLRPTDTFNEQYMGIPGSFRTLTVD